MLECANAFRKLGMIRSFVRKLPKPAQPAGKDPVPFRAENPGRGGAGSASDVGSSRKPEASSAIIEAMYPDLPKLELFRPPGAAGLACVAQRDAKFVEAIALNSEGLEGRSQSTTPVIA